MHEVIMKVVGCWQGWSVTLSICGNIFLINAALNARQGVSCGSTCACYQAEKRFREPEI